MKLRKLISAIAAVTMISSAMTTLVSADSTVTWDEGNGIYWVENTDQVSTRTPYIETSVKQLTGDEVAALKGGTTGISNLKLSTASGKYGDTTAYRVYEVVGTFKNVGDLVVGYDPKTEDYSKILLQTLDATVNMSSEQEALFEAISVDTTAESNSGVAWSKGYNSTNQAYTINLMLGAASKWLPTEEGLINQDFSYKAYFVVPVSVTEDIELSYSTAATVNYLVNGELVPIPVKDSSASFTLAAPGSEDDETPDAVKFYAVLPACEKAEASAVAQFQFDSNADGAADKGYNYDLGSLTWDTDVTVGVEVTDIDDGVTLALTNVLWK